ncbi:MAG: protoheme IX farnesyltransferase [Pyrinomonadaceae bacterium]|nr:protoheme IX farnesyltransferase [Phycisphaerales bacterium]
MSHLEQGPTARSAHATKMVVMNAVIAGGEAGGAAATLPRAAEAHEDHSFLSTIMELTKPRITRLVTITSAVGYVAAAVGRPVWLTTDLLGSFIGCLVGTACSASGANALNQWMERRRDGMMPRTCARPLPQRRLTPRTALVAGLAFCVVGVLTLLLFAGPAAALVSLSTILLYLLVYTPLKPVTTVSTLIGAVPGALPPLIGWTAAAGVAAGASVNVNGQAAAWYEPLLQAGGWSLFLLMFVWQIPHFLAIAWMYREDYAKGGYRMLSLLDPSGVRTSSTILLWSVALIPATLSPSLAMPDRLSIAYPIAAAVTGIAYLWLGWKFFQSPTRPNARRVFFASIMHLPLLLMVMVADAVVTSLFLK